MAGVTISYKGEPIAAIQGAQGTKTLKTAGKYCEGDITVDYVPEGSTPTGTINIISNGTYNVTDKATAVVAVPTNLIPKTITENGVYNASSDNADGYDVVTVDVPQDPNEQLVKLLQGTATFIKISVPSVVGMNIFPAGNRNCAYFSVKHRNGDYYVAHSFANFGQNVYQRKTFVNLDNVKDMSTGLFWNAAVYTLVLTTTSVNRLAGRLQAENFHYIYVRDSLVEGYKSASNWAAYGDKLKGYSEAPIYDNATTYEIGDVCQYNNKFYAYAKEDLTSSTGNPPTGTTTDNDYWEYIAEIEVI